MGFINVALVLLTPSKGVRKIQQKPELCIIRGMKINKTQFGLPIADTSTPINERVLSLARLIEQHGYTPQHPASLGLYTSIEITLFYLKENLPQRVLAQLYHCSQPTISRART